MKYARHLLFTLWLGLLLSHPGHSQSRFSLFAGGGHHTNVASRVQAGLDDSGYDVKWYFLDLEASNLSTALSGSVTILLQATTSLESVLLDLHQTYTVDSVFVGQREVVFLHDSDELEILLAPAEPVGKLLTVEIFYHGEYTPTNSIFNGIRQATHQDWNADVVYTLSEPYNAYHWWPAKQVLTDKADSVWIHVTTPNHLEVASSGLLRNKVSLPNGKVRHEWATSYPMAYYLLSIVIGDYQEYNFTVPTTAGGELLVQNFIYNQPGVQEEYAADIDATADIFHIFEQAYGPYPFAAEKYGHVMVPFPGGMEHQTMSMMGFFSYTLIAHELGHQWFGNSVTCGSWQDIWINEGFARYSEYLALEQGLGRAEAEAWRKVQVAHILEEEGGTVFVPESGVSNPSRIFDFRLTYNKGGQLLHMLRHELNDDVLFFQVLQAFSQHYANSTATAEDFLTLLNRETGQDFSWFFDQWYYGAGHPLYQVTWQTEADSLWLKVSQEGSVPEAPFFRATLPVVLQMDDGSQMNLRLSNTENDQVFGIALSGNLSEVLFDPDSTILHSLEDLGEGGVVGMPLAYRPSVRLYPQPATDGYAYIDGVEGPSQALLVDLTGRQHAVALLAEGNRWRIETTHLQPGMYQLRIEDRQGGIALPFVVQ